MAAYAQSPAMEVGRYLEKEFAPETVILHDPYVYVPAGFASAQEVWEPGLDLLESLRPDLVILNQGFFRRYVSFDNAAGLMRPEKRQQAAKYYRALTSNGEGGIYRPIRVLGKITILARVGFRSDLKAMELAPEKSGEADGN